MDYSKQEFLADRHIQHATQHSQFLMDRRCLQQALLHESTFCFYLHSLLEPPAEKSFDIVGRQFSELGVFEHLSQVLQRALLDLVGFRRTEWGPGNSPDKNPTTPQK